MSQRRGLGRGLGALIPTGDVDAVASNSRNSPLDTETDDVEHVTTQDGLHDSEVQKQTESVEPPASKLRAGAPRESLEAVPDPGGQSGMAADDRSASVVDLRNRRGEDSNAGTSGSEADKSEFGLIYAELDLDEIVVNQQQPRQVFDDDTIAELSNSIKEIGLLQPVVVRPLETGYELVAGERRLRACRLAGLAKIPALVRETDDEDMLRDALLENLHRVQLNPLEEAAAYGQLLQDFSCTQEELASRIGRSRPQISNTLRLLKLPPPVQRRVAAGVLSAGHARALLKLKDQQEMELLAVRVVAEGLSVRAVEELTLLDSEKPKARKPNRKRETPVEYREAADSLGDLLETRVRIEPGAKHGRLVVEFGDIEDLGRIMDLVRTGIEPEQEA